jgi:PAS domain S-box-containing protein
VDIFNHLPDCPTPFEPLLRETQAAVIVCDGEGKIVFWNKGALEVFGYTEGEILGKPATTIMHPRYHAIYKASVKKFCEDYAEIKGRLLYAKTLGRDTEITALRKNQVEFPCEINLVCYSEGVRKAFLVFVYDLSRGIFDLLRNVSQKLETIDQRLNTLEVRISGTPVL